MLARRLLIAALGGGSFTGGDMTTLGITSVKDYGAVGDGSTDDTTAITNAIAAIVTRGVLYFPPGRYKTSGGFTISVPMAIIGAGGGAGKTLNYEGGGLDVGYISRIDCTSATANLFEIEASGVQIEDLALINTAGSTPSAGAAIHTGSGGGDHIQYHGLTISGFYNDIYHEYGREWMMSRCYIIDPVNVGVQLKNTDAADELEGTIVECQFMQQTTNSQAMLYLIGSGGLRIHSCLFFGLGPSDSTSTAVAIKVNLASASSDISVIGCEIENYSDDAIYITGSPSPAVYNITIMGNQITSGRSTAKQAIYINHGFRIMIANNIFTGYGESYPVIGIDNSSHGVLIGNYWESFTALLGGSGQTDINSASNYS